jgi:hypothetical protein
MRTRLSYRTRDATNVVILTVPSTNRFNWVSRSTIGCLRVNMKLERKEEYASHVCCFGSFRKTFKLCDALADTYQFTYIYSKVCRQQSEAEAEEGLAVS